MVAYAIAFVGNRSSAQLAYAAVWPKAGEIVLTAVVGFAVLDLTERGLRCRSSSRERARIHSSRQES